MAVDLFVLSITDDSLQFLLGRTSKPRQNTAWAVRRIYIKSTYAWENNGFKGRNETKPHTRSRSQKVMVLRQEKSRIYTATHDQKIKKTACIQLFLWFCFLFLRCGLSRQIVCTGRNERWITHAILKEIKKIAFKVDGALRFWHFWEPRHHELAKQHLRNFVVFKNLKNFDGVIYIVHGPLRVLVAWCDSYFWWLLCSRTFARSEFLTTTMCSIKLDSTLHVLW